MALISRRALLSSVVLAGASVLAKAVSQRDPWAQGTAPAVVTSDSARPSIPYGVASGDVTSDAAIIWSRSNKPSRMLVEYATTDSFTNVRRVQGPAALAVSDFTARVELTDLPAGQDIFYRVLFQDLADHKSVSTPTLGHCGTAPAQRRDITFVWSGDTAGPGWGINPEWGGMRIYEQMRRLQPDFFIHSGDYIYADNPMQAEVKLEDGTLWKNILIPEKAKVAETLDGVPWQLRLQSYWTNTCAASMRRCRNLSSGTIMRPRTTGSRVASLTSAIHALSSIPSPVTTS